MNECKRCQRQVLSVPPHSPGYTVPGLAVHADVLLGAALVTTVSAEVSTEPHSPSEFPPARWAPRESLGGLFSVAHWKPPPRPAWGFLQALHLGRHPVQKMRRVNAWGSVSVTPKVRAPGWSSYFSVFVTWCHSLRF